MKRLFLLGLLALLLASCGSSRKVTDTSVIGSNSSSASEKKINKIVSHAKTFVGTKYKFGGTTSRGMDCSGLVYVSFQQENILLPRISRDMAKEGVPISLRQAEEGDLLFFQTSKNRKVINHVGLVVDTGGGVLKFIHSTTRRGVIISSLEERYWNEAFVEVRRII